jgi:hypothetical protein
MCMARFVPSLRTAGAIALGLVILQAVVLYLFGQPPICTCGTVKIWEGVVLGPGNSQHLSDWYSFSHVVHGFIFYALLAWLAPALPVRTRLLIALGVEIAWEITENTPMVIQHYREQALAQGYTGDSVINSVSDTVMMAIGYVYAWKFPWWSTVLAAVVLEAFVLYMIRDNLTLNIINLIHPVQAIADWQAAGGIK